MRGNEGQWASWMRAANAGNSGAYRLLLESLAPFLRRLARQGFAKAGLGTGDVEDVVQETLLAIHLKRQTWDADQAFVPWVRAIARNKLIDNLRRRGNRTEVPVEDFAEVLPAEPAAEELSPREAERLLSVLGGRQRDIVQAICVEGASIQEAAARFGISEGATRVALHRGLGALSAAYRSGER
ncbi:MAG: sigma-70 family RNA polymerase sigma factor [Rhodomicrobium sp.]|nr:sigma-70 family RNA polymerase sigma factor [Rhodomicrobium sp.]